jgi:hypothetical protein
MRLRWKIVEAVRHDSAKHDAKAMPFSASNRYDEGAAIPSIGVENWSDTTF